MTAPDRAGGTVEVHEGPDLAALAVTLARRVGAGRDTVRAVVGLELPAPAPARRHPQLEDGEWLAAAYLDQGRSLRSLAAEVGCARDTVARALERHGIERPQPDGRELLDDREWLAAQYRGHDRTAADIAGEVAASKAAVLAALRRHGIEVRAPGRRRRRTSRAVRHDLAA